MINNQKYRYDIQGLRALAVLFVFIFHLNKDYLAGGFIGVDVFFVISGYLITGIILKNKERNSFKFLDFYVSRIKRLIPVYVVFLITVLIICALFYLPPDMFNVRNSAIQSGLFISNQYYTRLDNYFGASSLENPLLHTWTLSIEMQFYLLLPLLLVFISNKLHTWFFGIITVLLLSYSFINTFYFSNKDQMYFSLAARIPEFLIGSLFMINEKNISQIFNKRYWNFLALFSIIISAIYLSEKSSFPGLWVLLPCLGTGILLINPSGSINQFLSKKFFFHIGELSYSIYLWHWPIMAIYRYYNDSPTFNLQEQILIIIITYILSFLSYKIIENKFRVLSNKKFAIYMAIPVIVISILGINILKINKKIIQAPTEYIAPSFGLSSHGSSFEKIDFLGDTTKKDSKILLIGDSNALVYKNFFDQLGKDKGFNFHTATNDSYPNIPYLDRKDFPSKLSYAQYEKVLEATKKEIEKNDFIIFISAYGDDAPSIKPALKRFSKELKKHQKLIFLTTYPLINKNPIKINKGYKKKQYKDNHYEIYYRDLPMDMKILAKNNTNIYIVSIDYKKWKNVQLPFKNDISLYYDHRHLNIYGTNTLKNDFGNDVYNQLNLIINDKHK